MKLREEEARLRESAGISGNLGEYVFIANIDVVSSNIFCFLRGLFQDGDGISLDKTMFMLYI